MSIDDSEKDKAIIDRAMSFLKSSMDAESTNRSEAQEDLRFSYGEQWPAEIQNSRLLEQRPCLTINKLGSYIKKVTNQQRQQRPRIKVQAVDSRADVKIADILSGICRHIEVNSSADTAYDGAFEYAVRMGWGYWRVITDYCRDDSFDQDIYIETVDNPFSVYFDPASMSPDGSDQDQCLIADLMRKTDFKRLYPKANEGASFNAIGTGDYIGDWILENEIRVAEYFEKIQTKDNLFMLEDRSTIWEDELERMKEANPGLDIAIIAERESFRTKVMWYKLTALEILERRELPNRWIPVIPVYGERAILDGKCKKFGIVRDAKDPQRMYNFWRTSMTESVALAPKAKWLVAQGADEGFEQEWQQANLSARPILHHKIMDNGTPLPIPQRIQPEPPPEGAMVAAMSVSDDLSSVLGIVEPAQRIGGNVSGKALNAERLESDTSNFHYYDNLTRSIAHTGRIILDLVPHYYDTERVLRIIGDDGRPTMVTVNQKVTDEMGAIQKILNDVTIGQYDVVMDTGPGYNTKRQEALEAFTNLLNSPLGEEVAKVGPDLAVRVIDAPGMETLADRFAAANPLAQLDEMSDIPESAQLMIKSLQQQLQQAQGAIQQLSMENKFRTNVEQMRQEGETRRELMRTSARSHEMQERNRTDLLKNRDDNAAWMHDMASRDQAKISVAELQGVTDLLLANKQADLEKFKIAADREERETQSPETVQ